LREVWIKAFRDDYAALMAYGLALKVHPRRNRPGKNYLIKPATGLCALKSCRKGKATPVFSFDLRLHQRCCSWACTDR
jgi:hypothetical protein